MLPCPPRRPVYVRISLDPVRYVGMCRHGVIYWKALDRYKAMRQENYFLWRGILEPQPIALAACILVLYPGYAHIIWRNVARTPD